MSLLLLFMCIVVWETARNVASSDLFGIDTRLECVFLCVLYKGFCLVAYQSFLLPLGPQTNMTCD